MEKLARITARTLTSCLLLLPCGCASHDNSGTADQPAGRLQKLGEEICRDTETGLMWQLAPTPTRFTSWSAANQYAEELTLGPYNDWRLPTYDELYELYDIFIRRLEGDCVMKQEVPVWYGATEKAGRSGYWSYYPACGGVEYEFIRRKNGRVRAVRP